MPLSL